MVLIKVVKKKNNKPSMNHELRNHLVLAPTKLSIDFEKQKHDLVLQT